MTNTKKQRRTDYDVILATKKKCKGCGQMLDETEYGIAHVFTRETDGMRVACMYARCRECQAKYHHDRWENSSRKAEIEKEKASIDHSKKVCKRCNRNLDKSCYATSYKRYHNKYEPDKKYLRPYCEECQKIINHEIWLKNKERLSSPEKLKENREHRKSSYFRYRAIKFRRAYDCLGRTSKELAWMFWKMWHRQGGLCAITGHKLTKANAQIDHIEPRVNGINNNVDNLQWATKDANRAKNQMTEEEFDQFIIDIYNHRNLSKKNINL